MNICINTGIIKYTYMYLCFLLSMDEAYASYRCIESERGEW